MNNQRNDLKEDEPMSEKNEMFELNADQLEQVIGGVNKTEYRHKRQGRDPQGPRQGLRPDHFHRERHSRKHDQRPGVG